MIAQLNGSVAWTADTSGYLVLDVGGVGYKVNVTVPVLTTAPAPGQPLKLVIHTLVREDDISLYGFADAQDLRVFELLLTVSGVGPKVALGLLSALAAADLAQAVSGEDVRTLTRVPGIGAKTAQRMVLELKDKFAALGFERRLTGDAASGRTSRKAEPGEAAVDDVVAALINLGYNKAESQRAAEGAREAMTKASETPAFAGLLRASLNRLTGGK